MPVVVRTTLLLAALTPLRLPAQDPVLLQHGLAPGSSFAFVVAVDAKVELPEPKRSSDMRFELHFAATVGAAREQDADVACRLTRIEAHIRSQAVRVDFDSATTRDEGPLTQLMNLVGETFTVRVGPTGAIARVDVPAPLAALTKEHLGADFESLFQAYFLPLPKSAVAVGSGWDAEVALVDSAVSGSQKIRVANRLLASSEGRATIGRTLHLPAPPARPGVRFAIQKAAGTAVFDVATGRVVTTELELIARATREVEPGAKADTGTSTLRITAATETEPQPVAPPHDR